MGHFRASLRRAAYLVYCAAAGYALAVGVYSTLYRYGYAGPDLTWYMIDAAVPPFRFDPDRGYFLQGPSRHLQFTDGVLEYEGEFFGNNEGFPDRGDFSPQRQDERRRIAIFGDSFTAAPFLDTNWPDRIEQDNPGLELLNFATDGGGLANWYSNLKHIVLAKNYELDGLIFAVFGNDLERSFIFGDSPVGGQAVLQYAESWDPAQWPKDRAAAQALLTGKGGMAMVDAAIYDSVRMQQTRPDLPRPWEFRAARAIGEWAAASIPAASASAGGFRPEQRALMEEMAAAIREKGWPVLVVSIPLRQQAGLQLEMPGQVSDFAALLGAEVCDGADAFARMSVEEQQSHWLPYDGHWNQQGSDAFAAFMQQRLQSWPGPLP